VTESSGRVLPGVTIKDASVNLADVVARLQEYVARLGLIHEVVFGEPLVVTSGRDGNHAAGSLHRAGRAVDVRSGAWPNGGGLLWLMLIAFVAPAFQCTVFDERALPGASHIHIEYHGV